MRTTWNRYFFSLSVWCLQILNNFSLESCNEGEVNLKSELIGIPDKKILISFRNLMSWKKKEKKAKTNELEKKGKENMEGRREWPSNQAKWKKLDFTLLICN